MILLLCHARGYSQSTNMSTQTITDSVKSAYLTQAAIQYPLLRQGAFSIDNIGRQVITAKLNGNDFFKTDAKTTRLRANINFPIAKWGKNNFKAGLSYQNQETVFSNVRNYNAALPLPDTTINKSIVGLSAIYSRSDSLFRRPVTYLANLTGLFDEKGKVRDVSYNLGINFPLKRTATTSYSLGFMYLNDPILPFHATLLINYWHKFQSSGLELFVDLPNRILVKKEVTNYFWVSFGSELTGSLAFYSLDAPGLPKNATASTLEVKTGPAIEFRVGKQIMLGVNGGILSTLANKAFKQGDNPTNDFISATNPPVSYVNFSISLLPFK
jgi:hypothetical protein